MMTISVLGAGTMGNGIAHTFVQFGHQVNLIDVSKKNLTQGINTIAKNLDRMVEKGKIYKADKKAALSNISSFTDLEEGVKQADLVVEAVTENEKLKCDLFKTLDDFCPSETILASNTSSISITKIAAQTKRADQVIGMHFMNPVPIMKLVEVIRGYSTSDQTAQKVLELTKSINKTPVEANDYPGFVANRILMPMINEAIESLYHDVAGVKEIDTVMKLGMAHPMGPLQLADFIGLDTCLSIMKVLHNGFKNPKYAPCPLLQNMVLAGKKGIKSGEGFYDYSTTKKAEKVADQFL